MGTRGAYGIKSSDKYYVTYNHFDSYPDGLGEEVVKFCRKVQEENGWDQFRQRVEALTLFNKHKEKPTPELVEKYKKYSDTGVSKQSLDDWYCLLKQVQFGEMLNEIYAGNLEHMPDDFTFLADSLFCEYAYIINLDDMTLEFYEGYNKDGFQEDSPLPFKKKEIEKKLKEERRKDRVGEDYYPVVFKGKAPLVKIPEDWIKKFYPKEED